MADHTDESTTPIFTAEQAKAALVDILEAFKQPDNVTKMEEARDNAGTDMMQTMMVVFPIATQIQMEVIPHYGFPADGEGIIKFAQIVRSLEKESAELAELNEQLRSIFIPKMAAPVT
ncbi:PREDICTED: protein C10-like [Priapulus caudatus]|uniref:Protein C10 n=1 Tax=Priapulus caudatus TaxID=37621 RepID=A0ABM1EWH7_PRICU|nr:PREDICTED: protein C10-like [Priapulus caudatus]